MTVLPLLGDADKWAALPLTENMDIVVSSAKGLPGIRFLCHQINCLHHHHACVLGRGLRRVEALVFYSTHRSDKQVRACVHRQAIKRVRIRTYKQAIPMARRRREPDTGASTREASQVPDARESWGYAHLSTAQTVLHKPEPHA